MENKTEVITEGKDKKLKNKISLKADDLFVCSRCGTCLAYCPVYKQTLNESFSPRGKMQILEAVSLGKIEYSDKVSEKIFTCTSCNICQGECPSGVKIENIAGIAREELVEIKKYPEVLDILKERIKKAYNVTFDSNAGRLDWIKQIAEDNPEKYIKPEAEVVYFVGCVSSFSPRSFSIPRAIVQNFEAAGVDFTLLGEDEWCCGFPLENSGIKGIATDFAVHNINAVKSKKAKILVTSCPSCYHTWAHNYKAIFSKDIDFEILHISQYLLRLIESGKLELKSIEGKITYHDPCDLGRNSGIYDEPRKVIQNIPGIEFVELATNRKLASCCGGGGNLESLNQELASKIALARADEIIGSGADVVITSCQQCNRTIDTALKKKKKEMNSKIKVMDLPELVLASIKENPVI